MELLKKFGQAVDGAFGALVDKHRKRADLNRIRTVIRCEERAAEKEYLALGRYYYNTLRDKSNPVAEPHCAQLDEIERRLEAALDWMRAAAAASTENCMGIIGGPGDASCPCEDEECEEIDLSDVESYDQDPSLETEVLEAQEPGEEEADLPFEG